MEVLYKVDGYTLVKCIGEGVYAVVFLARCPAGSRWAIKIVHKGKGRMRGASHAVKEIAALTHLRNVEGVVGLREWKEDESSFYIVLTYYKGYSIDELPVRLEIAEVLKLCMDLLDTIKRIHALGVYHLDIKPSNVMLSQTGIHLMDFGCSILSRTGLVEVGKLPFEGTPAYMAPEMVKRPKEAIRLEGLDVWAFGCLLYFMVTGQEAFTAHSLYSLYPKIISCEVNYRHLPKDVARICRRIFRPISLDRISLDGLAESVDKCLREHMPAEE